MTVSRTCINTSAELNMDNSSDPPTDIDPYEVLEIEATATSTDIKLAYKKLALKHHPGMSREYGTTI